MRALGLSVVAATIVFGTIDGRAGQLTWADYGKTVVDQVTVPKYGTVTIKWLADANLAAGLRPGDPLWVPGINPDGSMSLTTAVAFIAQLNRHAYLGITNWRLPTTYVTQANNDPSVDTDTSCTAVSQNGRFGYDCGQPTAHNEPNPAYPFSELAALFNALGGEAHQSITDVHNSSYYLFRNLQNYLYWSETGQANNLHFGNDFWFRIGFQATEDEYDSMFVLPVSTMTTGTAPILPPACPLQNPVQTPVCAGTLPGLGITTSIPPAKPTLRLSPDGQFLYDPTLNLAFLTNANLARTLPSDSPFRVQGINRDGSMDSNTLQSFLDGLNKGAFLGLTGWMVPTISADGVDLNCTVRTGNASNPAIGYNCNGPSSALGELFYDQLGGQAGHEIAEHSNWLFWLFRNLEQDYYWQCQPASQGAACVNGTGGGQPSFSFRSGYQGHQTDINNLFVMLAVPGDAFSSNARWWTTGHDEHER